MFTQKRTPRELLNLDNDDSGYLEGRIFMVWPPRNGRHRIQLEVSQDSTVHRFIVEIPYRDDIGFRPHEYILLALEGVEVVQETTSKTPFSIPILLRFPDGVVFKYLTGINTGKVIDSQENADEWWEPDTIPTVSEVSARDADRNRWGKRVRFDLPESPSSGCESRATKSCIQLCVTNQACLPLGERQHERLRLHGECVGSDRGAAIPHQQPRTANISIADNASIRPALAESDNSATKTTGHDFTGLSNLRKGNLRVNVVGAVTFVNPIKKTKTKEWHCSFSITDPSVVDSLRRSVTVNCFQKIHAYWLPQVQKDDVIILRQVKIVELNGALTITGYGDTLRWAIYDSLTHSIRFPDKSNLANCNGSTGSGPLPYWSTLQGSVELEYCKSLAQWWDSKKEFWDESSAPRRRHLVLSEVSPDLTPGGFFDCTVEVLREIDSNSAIYVTDYTANLLANPLQATWCPPELYGRVLRFEMWDHAQTVAKEMKPGEYWYLPNVRAKWNATHSMEGTVRLAERIARLDESAREEPFLKALLGRKSELGLDAEKLLQEVLEPASHIVSAVELLHDGVDSQDRRCLYVTDFTRNPDLPRTALEADRPRVLEILLNNASIEFLTEYEPGNILALHNLTNEHSNASGLYGYLGGQGVFVQPLHDQSDQRVQILARNKSRWGDDVTAGGSTNGDLYGLMDRSFVSLQEALARPAPDVFKVQARAVDYFPFALEDACALRCPMCEPSHSSPVDTCPKCGGRTQWFYRLYIQIQDEQQGQLITSLSGNECELLRCIHPTNFREDHEAFNAFLREVERVIGNLRSVHQAWEKNEWKAIEAPLMTFTIESWNIEEEKGYGVLDCTAT
ncbi:hypothetical protein L210DRAFT_3766845 [Boletus edulis BED1]|uniref:Telomeric single stranded DNA binding POT1/Cdc13 domain-containing protein n=1 Tax=Boletus edulis BED1 TaxID=1328754 RepID=A0AAD4BBU4_BOLED|nr:hypothetical protein L210DRAFT_3766845 [Boletus edulis BED1]